MCEHCGCWELGAVRDLHADHLTILDACGRLSDALTGAAGSEAVRVAHRALLDLLDRHERAEERGIYQEVARDAPEYIANLLAEHGEIGHLVRPPAGGAVSPDALRRGIAGLQRHIFTEEQDLFPYAYQILSHEQWDAVDAARAAAAAGDGVRR